MIVILAGFMLPFGLLCLVYYCWTLTVVISKALQRIGLLQLERQDADSQLMTASHVSLVSDDDSLNISKVSRRYGLPYLQKRKETEHQTLNHDAQGMTDRHSQSQNANRTRDNSIKECGVWSGNGFEFPTTQTNTNGSSWLWQLPILVYSGFASCPQQRDDDSEGAENGIPEVLADSEHLEC